MDFFILSRESGCIFQFTLRTWHYMHQEPESCIFWNPWSILLKLYKWCQMQYQTWTGLDSLTIWCIFSKLALFVSQEKLLIAQQISSVNPEIKQLPVNYTVTHNLDRNQWFISATVPVLFHRWLICWDTSHGPIKNSVGSWSPLKTLRGWIKVSKKCIFRGSWYILDRFLGLSYEIPRSLVSWGQ